jgi:hypothetical protein
MRIHPSSKAKEAGMSHRWCFGLALCAALTAGQPAPADTRQAWVLALDATGGVVNDLKPEEFQIKVDGRSCMISEVKAPGQTAEAPQSWILVFEPIRDFRFRVTAFRAAVDFLENIPEGDRVQIVARGKDSLESLMGGLSARRSLWAEAMAKVPPMLPEELVGSPKETLQGAGFNPSFTDESDGEAGQQKLMELAARFRVAPAGWAGGTPENRNLDVLQRLGFNDPMHIRAVVLTVGHEMKALESLVETFSSVPGQKHLVVFSRCEADDLAHPAVKQAVFRKFKRQKDDLGGPAESASLANRDMVLIQSSLKTKVLASGVMVYSVAGEGAAWNGNLGGTAQLSGGYAFSLRDGLENRFGKNMQVFGSRYLVTWVQSASVPDRTVPDEIRTSRKGVRLLSASR